MRVVPKLVLIAICTLAFACSQAADDTASPMAAEVPPDLGTDTHNVDELAPGVYFLHEAGAITVMSNSLVIVNDDDVVVVDSNVTPAAAEGLLATIRGITDKPISYLINTHYHFDHAHGNQSFPPEVLIVGHEYTREKLAPADALEDATFVSFKGLFRQNLESLEADYQVADAAADGAALADLEGQIELLSNHIEAMEEVVATPPEITLSKNMTLHRGSREIQLHFLGRGHTGGDVVVFLPKEKIAFTGDLLVPGPSYMGDAFVDEWLETLDRLKELDFETIAPGHGMPFSDRQQIDNVQAYMKDVWDKTVALRKEGASALETALRLDLGAHEPTLGAYTSPLLPSGILEPGLYPAAVERIYKVLDERGD